ncbi:MAG: hypothetical protein JWQ43_3761 [Glaciihabitans sp.]|nr:hypothetical protein [Glaciihabitans sp.]
MSDKKPEQSGADDITEEEAVSEDPLTSLHPSDDDKPDWFPDAVPTEGEGPLP